MLALGLGNSIVSASSITPTHDVHHLTGTNTINTIVPPSPDFCGMVTFIVEESCSFTSSGGNIARSVSVSVTLTALQFIYNPNTSKWYPNYN